MPFEIIKNDITKMHVDAIVNAANNSLLGGGGVDGAIHRAAGPKLLEECRELNGCETGQAKLTGAYNLPCKYVIHTVGPVWNGGTEGERELLASCYRNSLALAREKGCESVAFPLISAGAYGYPKGQALRVAVEEIARFLRQSDMTVYLVAFTGDAIQLSGRLFQDIVSYIDDVYVSEQYDYTREARRGRVMRGEALPAEAASGSLFRRAHREDNARNETVFSESSLEQLTAALSRDMDDAPQYPGESFGEMLLRRMAEKGITDKTCYTRANVDHRLMDRIRNNPGYRPARQTALALALALELPLDEARDLLLKAGYALSHGNKTDIAVEYCAMNGVNDVMELNQVLFKLELQQLGY